MKTFRMFVCIVVMFGFLVFIGFMPESLISPKGFFKAIGALFATAALVGFMWPDIPDPEAEEED